MPISLAASSQTQIGSEPSSNFRQRLSQSIIGTKQLNVEGTDSGPLFFIHTRNRAGCSLSLVQEVGLRILRSLGSERPISPRAFLLEWVRRSPKTGMWRSLGKDRTQMEVQVRREDCAALNQQSFGSNAIQFPDMPSIMHICARPRALWFWYGRREYC